MSNVIDAAELRRYNANSRNHDTGDCTIRALSIAYGIRYDDVHKELLKLGNGQSYYYDVVWTRFVDQHGYISHRIIHRYDDKVTLNEFADEHNEGTYLVLVGKQADKRSSHIVCLENGKVWDTWNSLSWYVDGWWLIREVENTIEDTQSIDQTLSDEYVEFINNYLVGLKKKAPYMDGYVSTSKLEDDWTLVIVVRCVPNDTWLTQFQSLIEQRTFNRSWVKTLRLVIKFNPKVDFDLNKSKTMEKARVQVREWMYQIRKTIEEVDASSKATYHPKFRGDSDDRRLVIKMPEWARPLLLTCVDYGTESEKWGGERYEAEMEALEGDPRKDLAPIVFFRADTIPELRSNLELYRTKFHRFQYDY